MSLKAIQVVLAFYFTSKIFKIHGMLSTRGIQILFGKRLKVKGIQSRLFGSKRGSDLEGAIFVSNDQNAAQIDEKYVYKSLKVIRDIIEYPTYDVTLVIGDDPFVANLNREYRGIDKPTDILSFPFYDEIITPGLLPSPEFDFEDYYCLGDMMISVPYVIRQMEEDKQYFAENRGNFNNMYIDSNDDDSLSIKMADERGVSAAIGREFVLEKRIGLLLIHGMLHLVGYDHIEDEDYLLMVKREEEVMKEWMTHMDEL